MARITLQPFRSDASYDGSFGSPAFGLLANPTVLYDKLLRHLAPYGAALDSLKFEAVSLPEANITCSLFSMGVVVRVRLDRLQVNFLRLHEVDERTAKQVLVDSATAVQESDSSIAFSEHGLSLTVNARIVDSTYQELMKRYVLVPESLGDVAGGVAFYLRPDEASGRKFGSIVLDRLAGLEKDMMLKVVVSFDGHRVSIANVADSADQFVTEHLSHLDLTLLRTATPSE